MRTRNVFGIGLAAVCIAAVGIVSCSRNKSDFNPEEAFSQSAADFEAAEKQAAEKRQKEEQAKAQAEKSAKADKKHGKKTAKNEKKTEKQKPEPTRNVASAEPKHDSKHEAKPAAKPEPKHEAKTAPKAKPEPKPEVYAVSHPNNATNTKHAAHPAPKAEKPKSERKLASGKNVVYVVQIGAFKIKENADKLHTQLKTAGYPVVIKPGTGSKSSSFHLVRLEPTTNKDEAQQMLETLKTKENLQPALLVLPDVK